MDRKPRAQKVAEGEKRALAPPKKPKQPEPGSLRLGKAPLSARAVFNSLSEWLGAFSCPHGMKSIQKHLWELLPGSGHQNPPSALLQLPEGLRASQDLCGARGEQGRLHQQMANEEETLIRGDFCPKLAEALQNLPQSAGTL